MRSRRLWIVTLTAATVVTWAAPARAAAIHTVADWDMNEPAGATRMRDGSGNGLDGRVGSEVATGVNADDSHAYHFARLEPDTPPARPQHLVVVPDADDLDPGGRDFMVTVRLRTSDQFGNIVQKGQATVAGGSFKLQIPGGKVQCWYRGSAGSLLVTAPRAINDGDWHTVQCWRTGQGVGLTIDGTTVASRAGATGTIENNWPLSIGGKTDCDQVHVGCDYFSGDLDSVSIHAIDHSW